MKVSVVVYSMGTPKRIITINDVAGALLFAEVTDAVKWMQIGGDVGHEHNHDNEDEYDSYEDDDGGHYH